MVKLSSIFSREKSLFYFCMWDESDRLGYERFAGHRIEQNLFLKEEPVGKTSVWYAESEMDGFRLRLMERLKMGPDVFEDMVKTLDEQWGKLVPYIHNEKKLGHIDEFETYYQALVEWWSAMTVLFHVPDLSEVDPALQARALDRRMTSQKYTEKMNEVLVEF